MSTPIQTYQEEYVEVSELKVHLLKGGNGDPIVVLHHDIGNPGWLAFHENLAQSNQVLVPEHPGWDQSERPRWARGVRDLAILYQWLLKDQGLANSTIVGLGFGGWIAAEIATMAPTQLKKLVLVGAMGIQPKNSYILDQALVNYIDYIKAGFADQSKFDAIFKDRFTTDYLETLDINREMSFRVAWKPYMFNQTLPHLLGGVATPTLVVWGRDDKIVPLECGERYAELIPNARLEVLDNAGHFVEMEQPEALARLVREFAG